ncbi:HAD-IIB family hydrolase [Acinetobacter sp. MB5]|uniref:HAD-IIB family hydrolase n=1 Tax=Acinetobacter sp. MB5 TaxID=2069438 RepID=UPI000DD0D981|nr:HAD-IIB family hydrolase [Acinetobacter sp. MB5]
MPFLIVTDLDGSLLDHNDYSWSAAEPCLSRLIQMNIPIMFCTSKTRSEVHMLQVQMGLSGQPAICENGAILLVEGKTKIISADCANLNYCEITQILDRIRAVYGLDFTGFHDVDTQQIMKWTNLPIESARLAQERLASEPIIWQGTSLQFKQFQQCLEEYRLCLIQGGRFWHVMNIGSDKGAALSAFLQQERHQQRYWKTVGLGDSPNDLPLLEITNFAVVIRTGQSNGIALSRKDLQNIYYSEYYGPKGWCQGIQHFLCQ